MGSSSGELDPEATLGPDDVPALPALTTPGARVDRYVLLEEVGRGGSGTVYAAFDPKLDRKVALKVVPARDAMQRVLGEAKTLAQLSHPNIVAVYDAGTTNDQVFLSMEFVDGHHLGVWMRQRRPWREVVNVFSEAARGLAAAHDAGVIHRDFKPSNILVDDNRARVVDFGLAVSHTPSSGEESCQRQRLAGTPAYIAPEQVAGRDASAQSDQFAFFVSLFEALLGRRPFHAATIQSLLAARLSPEIDWPESAPAIPKWLRALLVRGLSRRPEDRFADMHVVAELLEHDRFAWARRAAVVLGAAAFAGAAALGGYWYTRPGNVALDVTGSESAAIEGLTAALDDIELDVAFDASLGSVSASGEVPPGRYRLVVEARGYVRHEAVLDVRRGGTHQLAVALEHETGLLDLDVEPRDAQVIVGGVDYGSRLRNFELDTGRHTILVRKLGHMDATFEVDVVAGGHAREFRFLPRAVAWRRPSTGPTAELNWVDDVTGDGRDELLHRNWNRLALRDPWNDEALWQRNFPDFEEHMFVQADLDGDGATDVVVASRGPKAARVEALSGVPTDGALPRVLWVIERVADFESEPFPPTQPHVFDAGAGRRSEIVFAAPWGEELIVVDAPTGKVRSRSALPDEPVLLHADAGVAFVVGTASTTAWALPSLSKLWTAETPKLGEPERASLRHWMTAASARQSTVLRISDLDEDGAADVVVPHFHGALVQPVALRGTDGKTLWVGPKVKDGRYSGARLTDLSGDGVGDVALVGEGSTEVLDGRTGERLWKADGHVYGQLSLSGRTFLPTLTDDGVTLRDPSTGVAARTVPTQGRTFSNPVVADIDGDGADELVVADRSALIQAIAPDGRVRVVIPTESDCATRGPAGDHDGDGFDDVLLQCSGATVLKASNLRWERRALEPLRVGPVVEDLDGDGRLEVATVGAFSRGGAHCLAIFDADTGLLRATSPALRAIRGITPVAADRGGFDIFAIAHTKGGSVQRLSGRDASVIAKTEIPRSYAEPAVVDLDGDGALEVIAVPWKALGIQVFDADLALKATFPTHVGSWVQPSTTDIDGDGVRELLTGYNDGKLLVLSSANGAPLWSRSLGVGKVSYAPLVVDLDGDKQPELLSASTDPDRRALIAMSARDGAVLWRAPERAMPGIALAARDIDGDGRVDIFSAAKGVYRLDTAGKDVWSYVPRRGDAVVPCGRLALADLEGNGSVELLALFDDGSLRVLDAATGKLLWAAHHPDGAKFETAAVARDVDGDGVAEVFITGWDRALRSLRVPTRARP